MTNYRITRVTFCVNWQVNRLILFHIFILTMQNVLQTHSQYVSLIVQLTGCKGDLITKRALRCGLILERLVISKIWKSVSVGACVDVMNREYFEQQLALMSEPIDRTLLFSQLWFGVGNGCAVYQEQLKKRSFFTSGSWRAQWIHRELVIFFVKLCALCALWLIEAGYGWPKLFSWMFFNWNWTNLWFL